MASPSLEPKPGNTVSLFLIGEAYQELKSVFDKLVEGADPGYANVSGTPFRAL